MGYKMTLIAVKDMEKAKQFYDEVLGVKVLEDYGAHVILEGGLALQTTRTWKDFIYKEEKEIIFQNNAGELYFEEEDIEEFLQRLEKYKEIEYIHPLEEQPWGQRVIRFYDLDKHIIEVGESISKVMERFLKQGLSIEETAIRMDVSVDYIKNCLEIRE